MSKKTVKISCEAAATIDLESLSELQGNLKILSDDNYERLKKSILANGFSFPIHAWKESAKKIYILDATQRTRTLKKMRDDGYHIPKLPVAWVQAKDKKEATRKLLAAASQYGEVTPDGLHEYMKVFHIDMSFLKENFKFPEINLGQFESSYFGVSELVSFNAKTGSKELSESDFQDFDHQCPKCNFSWSDKK